ncbi:GDSL esterase/lipase [Vitis vinifera]|uniref:GDSL esterase/lipase n=1 Tax=Vitis vinifera TaxID=29760 RepID=A0A438KKE3_VITVI|nr:GDSL esterase/lipase [Vitis vinifera]
MKERSNHGNKALLPTLISPPLSLLLDKITSQTCCSLYIFGDSDLDNGNNNDKDTLAKANYPPYGIDYPKGTTGRFTNGLTIADYLGLQLEPDRAGEVVQKNRGYNPSSAPETPEAISRHLSSSIFLVLIGSNDYAMNYLLPQFSNSSRLYNPEQFAELLLNELGNHLREMYRLGGRNFVVFEIGPIGCLPTVALENAGTKTRCVEKPNDLVSIFNAKLASNINQLTSSLQHSTFVLVKTFNLVHGLVENPSRNGFNDSRNPCCVISDKTGTCIPNKTRARTETAMYFGMELTTPMQ